MKLLIFLPIIIFFGFFALLVFGFFFLIFKLVSKSKNSAWSGVVIDKKHNQKEIDDDGFRKTEHYYYLVVKTKDRPEMKVGLSRQMWDNFKTGDKIEKPKGTLYPKKV